MRERMEEMNRQMQNFVDAEWRDDCTRSPCSLQMRERMEEMNRQMQNFVEYVRSEMLSRFQQSAPAMPGAIVPLRKPQVPRPTVVAGSEGL